MDLTSTSSSAATPSPDTNRRSILRMSTGRRVRYCIDENPVPKSSTATWTPSSRSGVRRDAVRPEVLHRGLLGDLQREALRRQARRRERGGHGVGEVVLGELEGGDVDRDAGPVVRPLGELDEALGEHPGAHRDDQAGLLRERDELRGRAQLVTDRPPDEALEAVPAQGVEVDDRLQVQREAAAVDDGLQLGPLPRPLEHALGHPGLEGHGRRTAALLRPVHREVGVAQRGDRRAPLPDGGDADARRDRLPAAGLRVERRTPQRRPRGRAPRRRAGRCPRAGRRTRRRRAARRRPSGRPPAPASPRSAAAARRRWPGRGCR